MTAYLASIGPALANHLWQSTLFAMAVWLVTLLLRGNRAQVRYRLWLAASIKFLVPFSLLTGLGTLLPKAPQAAFQAQPTLYSTIDIVSQPFLNLTPSLAAPVAHVASFTEWLPLVLAAIWLCGAVVMLLVWLARWRQISRTLQQSVLAEDGREWEILRQVDARLPLMRSQESMEPGIFGVFRPVLLWPERLSARLDDEHIEAILLHELMHVWRHDNLTAALHMMVEAIFWFHPIVWWIERRMVEERERACDEAVIQMGGSAEAYAESLVKACRFCVESPLTCVSGITGADLNQRITAIMQHKLGGRLGLGKALLLTAMGIAIIAGPLVFGQADTALHAAILASPKLLSAPPPPPPPPPPPKWQTAAGGKMVFDIASIKPSKPGTFTPPSFPLSSDDSYASVGGDFSADFPLTVYIEFAYKILLTSEQSQKMFAELPKWVRTERFSIHAKATGNPTKDQMRLMVQSLLADRFNLAVHFETQETPVLILTLDKSGKMGPKLHLHADGLPCDGHSFQTASDPASKTPAVFPASCDVYAARPTTNHMVMLGSRDTTMDLLAPALTTVTTLGRPVVNRTGLAGRYDFTLEWTPEPHSPLAPHTDTESDPAGLTFLEALKDQLGLKLQPAKAPLSIMVIDHVEQPSEN